MKYIFSLLFGGFMILLGVFMLWCLPRVAAIHTEMQKAGQLSAGEAPQKRKNILVGGILAIASGLVLILMVVLRS
jgi:hypothetical protein